jgi:NAD(P)H-dependent flavin oxidoreductase YrpB (nitropropane dioxygenase family)
LNNTLEQVRLIQGGMGVYVSNWRLAKAVASEQPGVTVGTVSGTALDVVYVRLLQLGDPGGHARRALQALDARVMTCRSVARFANATSLKAARRPTRAFAAHPCRWRA